MVDLITIEGFERSGKDSLLSSIRSRLSDLYVYEQPASETAGVSYRDTEKFQVILEKHFRKMVGDLKQLDGSINQIVLTRFLISDNIYSDLFGRIHMLENMISSEKCFIISPFVLLWKNYDEYLKRVQSSNSLVEYSLEEFQKIQSKFVEYCQRYHGKCVFITNDTSREDIFNEFQSFISEAN